MSTLTDWFGAGRSIGWIVVTLVTAGVGWGVLSAQVKTNQQELRRMDAKTNYINEQVITVKENRAGDSADLRNLKRDISEIKSVVDDVHKILIRGANNDG